MPCKHVIELAFATKIKSLENAGVQLAVGSRASSHSPGPSHWRAKMASLAFANASCMASSAVFLAFTERVASLREDVFAARAACSGDAFVRDILNNILIDTCICQLFSVEKQRSFDIDVVANISFDSSSQNFERVRATLAFGSPAMPIGRADAHSRLPFVDPSQLPMHTCTPCRPSIAQRRTIMR